MLCRAYYLDPLTYSVYGLIASQLGDVHDEYIKCVQRLLASIAQIRQCCMSKLQCLKHWILVCSQTTLSIKQSCLCTKNKGVAVAVFLLHLCFGHSVHMHREARQYE